jgi:histidyl-tRNA synthetase
MSNLIDPVRGMNDVLAQDAPLWERLESAAAGLFSTYGYERIRLPVLERTELFQRSIGELTDIVEKEMYTFTDRNEESVTLRPEATAGVVRAALTNGLLHNQQQKLWCSGPMFRREKPQKGRYRQFHQLSLEALGYAEPEIDAELIIISARLWRELGICSISLEMNSLGTADARAAYKRALVGYFSRHRADLDEDSQRRLERNPMRILDSKNPQMRPIVSDAPLLADHLDAESREHFARVQEYLSDAGVAFTLNPRLVRGLDYYSRTVFEWVTDRLGAQGAVCSGGRYDGLVEQLGGRDTPAVGWALGVERVVELMRADGWNEPARVPDVLVIGVGDAARRKSFAIAESLRDRLPRLRVLLAQPQASLKTQLKRADRSGARYALIIGEDELASDKVSLKALRAEAPQRSLSLDETVETLRREADAGKRE